MSESVEAQLETSAPDVPESTGNEGIVYILENEAFEVPVVKIGRATNLSQRINTLNTAVPLPFTCYKASRVSDTVAVERMLHQTFHPAKNQWSGEFYEVEAWRVAQVLSLCEIEDVTHLAPKPSSDEEKLITAKVQQKDRKNTATFASLGIPIGAKLQLVGNSEIQCEVADSMTGVRYEGNEYSLSTLATRLKNSPHWLQGIRFWMYKDETLIKRRDRQVEPEHDG